MTSIVELIRDLASRRGMNLGDVERATKLGINTIYKWDKYNPRSDSLKKVADFFGVPMEYFFGDTVSLDAYQIGHLVSMPLIGTVKAGYNGLPLEDYLGEYENVPESSLRGYDPSTCRCIRVRGSSMYPQIVDGDTVIVHLQNDVDSGEIAVVMIDGEDATIKQVVKESDRIRLVPRNPEYEAKVIFPTDDFRIWGKVLTLVREF